MSFSAKTHKEECPFRVIISEKGCWQETFARFLQAKLKVLTIDNPFMISSSNDVIEFLKDNAHVNFSAFSLDIKDLYYSFPIKNCSCAWKTLLITTAL